MRHVFGQYPTGVAVVAVHGAQGHPVAMTINSFTTLSLHPPLVAWSIGERAADLPRFRDAPRFGISLLSSRQEAVARRFADPLRRRDPAGAALFEAGGAAPRVGGAVGWLLCAVQRSLPMGDHLLIVGQVESAEAAPGEALAYHRSRYARIDGRAGTGSAAWT
ncbi:flavin reductase family protein [Bacillus subtilis subsp. subtilis]|nr:flavin reductase family protein [Bacillus subtilis subsp. subtilis]